MGLHTPFLSLGTDAWTGKPYHLCSRKSLLSFAIVLALVLCMMSERLLFKVMVDRMESYRYFLCQMMTFMYIPPLFCLVGYKSSQPDFIEEDVTEFPKRHFFVMAMLDGLHSMMIFIAGGRTEPTQTLLFMQAFIPISGCISYLLFGTKYSKIQIVGMVAITAAIMVSLFPSLEDFESDVFEERESAWNSIFYLLAAVPGALSMVYKERAIRDQPMDMVYLNAWVSVYQFIGGLMLAPIVFNAEVLHLDQKMSGLECLINGRSELTTDQCHLGSLILMGYVVSNVAINLLLMQVIKLTSISVMYASTFLGFFASFVALAWYQANPNGFGSIVHDENGILNWIPASIFVDVIAFCIMVGGKILYQWDPDPEVQATTMSAEDKEAASLLTNDDDFGLRYM